MELIRGKTTCKAMDGRTFEKEVSIERESEKAFLIQVKKPGQIESHWVPKKLVEFSGLKLTFPDWVWERK